MMKKLDKIISEIAPEINSANKYQINEIKHLLEAVCFHDSSSEKSHEFEKRFAKVFSVKHAISCNSGTSGLHAALYAAGVGPGDEVIVPALTVIMDTYCALHLSATPVFVDVNEETHLISLDAIKAAITPKTKVIVTVSWEGLSCDMEPIMELARANNIIVVDDSARTVLGYYNGKLAGTIADISVFSFEAKKHLSAGGEGGMIVSNNEELAQRARKFAGIGYRHLTADAGRTHLALEAVQNPNYKRFDTIGLNYRMNEVSAAIGLGQLERIEEIVGRRKAVGKMYEDISNGYDWFVPQRTPTNCVHAYYTFSVDFKPTAHDHDAWQAFYRRYVEKTGDGFYGVVAIPYLEPALSGKHLGNQVCAEGLCPVAEGLQQRVMCFKTNYRDLLEAESKVEKLSNILTQFNSSN